LILGGLIYYIEMLGRRQLTYFFVVFGRNPLFIYLLSELVLITLYLIPFGEGHLQGAIYTFFTTFLSPVNASLLFALAFMMFCWLIGWVLDRRGVYIKV
jgi:predicted acyltransferase